MQSGGSAGGGTGSAPPSRGQSTIVLYMPNSQPAVGNGQNWNNSGATFQGPLGAEMRDAAVGLAGVFGNTGENFSQSVESAKASVKQYVEQKSKDAQFGDAGKQALLEGGAAALGTSANAVLAISKGTVYNPNVELLYTSPGLRTFTFQYSFMPKNERENEMMNNIIRKFKEESSPRMKGSMFKVPNVFQVTYMSGKGRNRNMNRFKKAALKNVVVQANPQTAMHVAHSGGAAIETTLSLEFMETNLVMQEDHQQVGGQGF